MKTISLKKRLLIYFIDMIIYGGLTFLSIYPFIFLLKWHVLLIILLILVFLCLYTFLFTFMQLTLFKGYTLVTAILGIKVVGVEEKNITVTQSLIRALNYGLWILLIYDLIYLIKNRTERGIIDRLSDTFLVETRY